MNDEERSEHGGARSGAGRPYLNGNVPGKGEYALKKSFTIPRTMYERICATDTDRNFSRAVRTAIEFYLAHLDSIS